MNMVIIVLLTLDSKSGNNGPNRRGTASRLALTSPHKLRCECISVKDHKKKFLNLKLNSNRHWCIIIFTKKKLAYRVTLRLNCNYFAVAVKPKKGTTQYASCRIFFLLYTKS